VGTGIVINTTGYTISGTNSANYTLTQPILSGDITAAELMIVGLTGDNKVYDGTTAATATGTATLSGIFGADDVILGGAPVFTFASANVGTGITMFTSGYTISGTDSGNYTLTQPTLSGDITAAELTIVGLTGDNKVYDGTTAATASGTATLSGIIGADDVILGGSPFFTFADANVGTGIVIFTSDYTISGTDSGNYSLTQPTLSGDITAAELTIVGLTGDNKVYDGTTAATASGTATLSGIIGADDVILGGSPVFTFASANVGTGITINTSGYTISGTNSGNYTLTQPTLSADITAATLTVVGLTGDDKIYDGTPAATASGTAMLSGIIGADDVILGGSPVFVFTSNGPGANIPITTTGYTISGTDSGNYLLEQPTLSAEIFGPMISFNASTSNELEGTGSANITVDLSVAVPISVTVDYTVTGGSATTADYTLADGTLTFDPNTSSNDILITLIDELMVEPDETVEITLSNPTVGTLGAIVVHTFTITNDDSAAVTIEDVSGNEDDGDLTFTATLDNPVQGGFTVDVNTLDVTATVADSDYTPVTGQILTFAGTAGETQTFVVTPTADNKVEEDETITIGMTTVDNTPSFDDITITDLATGTFLNEDTTEVTITEDTIDVDEDAGFATLTATLSNPVQGGFFIHVTTADGTAVATDDYTAFNDESNATFSGIAGETQSLLIPIVDDSQGELSETFTVTLSSVSGTTLGSFITTVDAATVTIIDNDAPVVSQVDVPADGLYGIGTDLDFTVTFTDFVTTTGTPVIPITIGTTTVNAELTAPVTNSLTAVFRYTVVENDLDLDGIAVGTDIDLNGGTIIGTNSNIDAILTLNGVGSTANVNVDGVRPIPVVDSTDPDPTNAQFTVTIDFDKDVTGFVEASISVVNGTVGSVTDVDPRSYTAVIIPTTDGIVTVSVPADGAFDEAGNGNVASNDFSILYDATNPTPTITTTAPDPVNVPFLVEIEFDEDVFGFTEADLVVTNGTTSDFTPTSDSVYSVLISPTGAGDVIVEVPAAVAEDLATNPNNGASFTIEYDNIPPLPPNITHISEYTCAGDVMQTGDNTLEIFGTAERESTVEVFIDGISIGTVVTDEDSGFWSFDYTGTTLADGTYSFTAIATDIAMNTGDLSAPFTITVNTVDSDGDGNPDFCDEDDDGNGATDTEEDCDGDGIVDSQDTDNSSCRQPIQQRRTYGFSPNGDGVNEAWVIENITSFPNNVVQVFNRSGKLVFKQNNYQNDWEAESNQLNGNTLGRRLPVGPYIYVIDLGDGSAPIRGWLYINY
jgi:gliding motility-associated-like protein